MTLEELKKLIAEKAKRMAEREPEKQRILARTDPAQVGDVYILLFQDDIYVEWVVVRPHPDDNEYLLIVPIDDFPFMGMCDIRLFGYEDTDAMVARCNHSHWIPRSWLSGGKRVEELPSEFVKKIRQTLAKMARLLELDPLTEDDVTDDPDYMDWEDDLEQHFRDICEDRNEMK
jgi:hypothetical protein